MGLRLLATADLHLGRLPGRLPEPLTRRIAPRELGPGAAWARLVEMALAEEVHAVLLAGDVVEAEQDFFEAFRELRDGAVRLLEAGVRVIAVAGNHDTFVLPRLSDELDGFELLGRGGRWERTTVSGGDEAAAVWGWSFPTGRVRESPLGERGLREIQEAAPSGGVRVGLLHCDRDQPGSPYAPVSARELDAAPVDAWLLGHIHRGDPLELPRPVGYLGALTGLDPGEPGPRGPWLLTVDGGRLAGVEHRPLAPLRWVRLDVELDGIVAPEDARERFLSGLRQVDRELEEERDPPKAVGIRATFTGRTRFRYEVAALFREEDLGEVPAGDGSVHYFVETLRLDTMPEVELEELARRGDPAGLLARRLLLLDAPADDPERAALVARGRRELERVANEPSWEGVERGPPDERETVEWLRTAGRQALDALLAQTEEA